MCPFTGKTAAFFARTVALSILRSLPEVAPERAAAMLVAPDVSVDRFVADLQLLAAGKPAAGLFGAEIGTQQLLDRPPLGRCELTVLARSATAAIGGFLRSEGTVRTVGMSAVA